MGWAMLTMMAAMAEVERRRLSERMKDVSAWMKERGLWYWGRIPGYGWLRKALTRPRGKPLWEFVPDMRIDEGHNKPRFEILRDVLRLRGLGWNRVQIVKEITDNGNPVEYHTVRGILHWHKNVTLVRHELGVQKMDHLLNLDEPIHVAPPTTRVILTQSVCTNAAKFHPGQSLYIVNRTMGGYYDLALEPGGKPVICWLQDKCFKNVRS